MLWLITLPFALWPVMAWATIPAVCLTTYLTLGIDEIGIQIEEPFCILPVGPGRYCSPRHPTHDNPS